ncbi:hypothetical protein CLV63_103129 [Murinocardiopsis flavida]|uniref:DUF917 family protein n=1 Tax=Murinocardiopsis flavida TaxID=645275 RepID=A0A2P8DQA0_9ACTN|nr:DUF917 family protein [Murinocardiopsis flavida]PSK99405.1 hypothetical protein CLV63_103129 [Murinocardiopsis flavida]
MRELTADDARYAVLGGGVFAAGGGGWLHHGELMGGAATTMGRPVLASVAELPADSWVATVTAIGAPAAKDWEIRPVDYVDALKALMAAADHPIAAVMTAQNGYSTTLNGWIQSAVLGVKVLDAAGDIRAHPTGKLGALGLTTRPGYMSVQSVSGGNRALHGHFQAVTRGSSVTCDDVLRDISVRTGGFIASARNPVELDWVRRNAALGAITAAIDLGRTMADAAPGGGAAVIEAVTAAIGGAELARGPLAHAAPTITKGGWDHGVFRVADHTVPYLNEFMAVDAGGARLASYPDMIALLAVDTGLPLAVKDAVEGMEVAVVAAPAAALPTSASACDVGALREVEEIMGIDLVAYLPDGLHAPAGGGGAR